MENYDEDYTAEKIDLGPWKKILKTVFRKKSNLIGLVISVTILACLDVIYPLVNQYAIDHYFKSELANRFDNVALYVTISILVALMYGLCVTSFIHFAGKTEAETSYQLRKEAYSNLQRLPFSYFDSTPQGWIMARMTSDARRLSDIISWGIVDLFWGILTMTGILIVLFIVNWKLALVLAVVLPIMFFVAIVVRKKILKAHRDARRINSQITASYNEGFMGSKTTKSLVIEDDNKEDFHSLAFKYRKSALVAVFFGALFGPIMFVLGYIGVAGVLYVGALISFGSLYLFVDYAIKFFDPVMSISGILAEFQQAQASAERIISLIETKPEIEDTPEVIEKYGDFFNLKKENWEELEGKIEFKDVTFKYNKGETVLKNFNLVINKGASVALVGHTGSGKSTIVNLICRFYEPSSGEILIDDRNYKERSISWLHSNIGYVLQSPQLFSGTIKENIIYGKKDATMEEVIKAAKLVNAHEFISKLDKGYDSEVGEGGSRLSVGERQLISFARAIISDPKIIILDEATSSIDTETEVIIQNALKVVLKGRTSIVIAHRLSTVVNSDKILVLDNGIVKESGTHKELLEMKGYYYDLYRNQFIKEKEEQII